ncbi:hypothetical protein B0T26DRAFT_653783 [Lasiosphaeria miniovina]|uniref:G-patch domain-containing protein n=1 Tax=Lasiosphaeria miniovina TaxID=1954250 RepID=A0AA40DRS6_9PEZI|nr:uncharacterized protein B0T26DRAFT_653783 [Lasiosphaeria miniovina]KAK0709608.1 hypothetical protein B0T26DRAFT_653783 [Lasiosphaeria miniovina]
MSYKRSRGTFEADIAAQQSPYVIFGTALPPLDPEVRDDGSFVPVWKQEVRDERGRKRLHGAFTGGWSAGYFNTVGSKEGWTPSTFVSSRTNRHKDDSHAASQRPEDFMDDEDLADAEESKRIQATAAFTGLGSTEDDASRASSLMGLSRTESETMGTKLLRKMGWKEGQGVGPKIRRTARLELRNDVDDKSNTFLFAPENIPMIGFTRKLDRKGLGYAGESTLLPAGFSTKTSGFSAVHDDIDADENIDDLKQSRFSLDLGRMKKERGRGGIGIGVLNDTGSDDEDHYEIGPRISYNRIIGGDRKKKKAAAPTNSAVKTRPTFIPKKAGLGRVALGVRKCHDGRLPLDGFVFGKEADTLLSTVGSEQKYPPPEIPADWVSAKVPKLQSDPNTYVSTADAAKASTLDPKSRAALLGEKQLPSKSIFDFLSPAARDHLASVTGKTDLPEARGGVPAGYALTEADRLQNLINQIPKMDMETAIAAISRGVGVGAPYAEDEQKRSRYRAYLEYQAGFNKNPPQKPSQTSTDDWLRELKEFFECARIFKPMTGLMASRFTTSSSSTKLTAGSRDDVGDKDVLSRPPAKPQDPAEEAAKLGMFGPLTRSVVNFYPTRLLCKRFNVRPPAHVQPDQEPAGSGRARNEAPPHNDAYDEQRASRPELLALKFGSGSYSSPPAAVLRDPASVTEAEAIVQKQADKPAIDSTRNDALEGAKAGEDVFKAIFGDSDDDD